MKNDNLKKGHWLEMQRDVIFHIPTSFFLVTPWPGGVGVLGLEKGTNCGPTAAERWQSRREIAKKGGLSSYYIVR